MRAHELKTWPEFFQYVWTGLKKFELRIDDRAYRAGDILLLQEWTILNGYTGREIKAKVTYLMSGLGLQQDYVVMSIDILDLIDTKGGLSKSCFICGRDTVDKSETCSDLCQQQLEIFKESWELFQWGKVDDEFAIIGFGQSGG